ncbi:hypothetical protein Tco_1266385, partial [Tanacetum coccineum]
PDGGGRNSFSADGVFVATGNGSNGVSVAAGVGADGVSVAAGVGSDGVSVAAGVGADGVSIAAGVGADTFSVATSDATDAETEFALMGLSPQLSPATCRWGKVCHRGTNCLTEKRVGPTSSLGIIAGDCIPDEDSPATFRWGKVSPATCRWGKPRNVAGENPDCCSDIHVCTKFLFERLIFLR